ncbi:MAG: EAL domain-containing protein [Zoogloeaceae bacterium]|jgi:EAL domain-containing protein (putative c-di-GMP-specific phosphodiesterase class I)|nr:EAL domain-containing protein [Zoogloeaceae bacterium]
MRVATNIAVPPSGGAYTLVFGLRGFVALETIMGKAATESALAALRDGIHGIAAAMFTDRDGWEIADDPPGVWRVHGRDPPVRADGGESLEERRAVVLRAATQLAGELARDVFGNATARLADLRIARIPGVVTAEAARTALDATPPSRTRAAEKILPRLIAEGGIRTFLQPLVHFPNGRRMGYEALSRGPAGSAVERADQLFNTAACLGLTRELEITCARQALAWADRLSDNMLLAINLSSLSLRDSALRRALARPGLIVEITEHLPLGASRDLLPLFDELRAGGAQIALDDTGCGFSDLETARILRPDFVKLCITIIRGVGRHPETVLAELEPSIARMRALGIRILAEGVENEREAARLAQLDIDYAQGWHYGRPQPAETLLA